MTTGAVLTSPWLTKPLSNEFEIYWQCAYCGRLQDKDRDQCAGCTAPKRNYNDLLIKVEIKSSIPEKDPTDTMDSDGHTFWMSECSSDPLDYTLGTTG